MRLVSRKIVVKSRIIDVFIKLVQFFEHFLLGLELGLGFVRCTYVRQLGLGLGLGLQFVDTRKINFIC